MCNLFKYKLIFTEQDYRTSHVQDQDYRVPVDIAQQLKLPPPPPPPSSKSPLKKSGNHDNVESIDMELSDDESAAVPIQTLATSTLNNTSSSSNSVHHSIVNSSPLTDSTVVNNNNRRHRVYGNKKIPTLVRHSPQDILEPPPPIPENLCDIPTDGDVRDTRRQGKNQDVIIIDEDGPLHQQPDMLIPQLCEMNPATWAGGEEWFDGRPPDFVGDRPFPGGFQARHKGEFRGPYRSRGRGGFADHPDFRNRMPRTRGAGMRSRSPRGGFNRGRGGFRGQFRGGNF